MDDDKRLRKVTLCLLVKDDKVLLAMKKRGFGVGKWNGVGGKLNDNETVEEAMLRETKEEISVVPKSYLKKGVIKFFFDGKPEFNQEMNLFVCKEWEGEPLESEEMAPQWFVKDSIPFNKMWEDDILWLPHVLHGKNIEATFFFDASQRLKDYNFKLTGD